MSLHDDNPSRTLQIRVALVEAQLKRIVADIESEKGTRSRANADQQSRIVKMERALWFSLGGIAFFQFALSTFLTFWSSRR